MNSWDRRILNGSDTRITAVSYWTIKTHVETLDRRGREQGRREQIGRGRDLLEEGMQSKFKEHELMTCASKY